MCIEAICQNSGCGLKTWWGCGSHIPSVMAKLSEEEKCTCKQPEPARPAHAPAHAVNQNTAHVGA